MESVGEAASKMWKRRARRAHRLAWTSMAVLLLPAGDALAAKRHAPTPREVSELAPVWQVDVAEDSLGLRPRVVVNAFAGRRLGTGFPIPELPLRRVVHRVTRTSWGMSNEIARLRVRPDGRLESRKPRFVASNRFSVDPLTGRMTLLILTDTGGQHPGPMEGDSTAAFAVDKGAVTGDLYRWEESPDRSWCLVHTSTGTTVFTRASLSPKAYLESRIYDGGFSWDGSRYAAVAEVGTDARPARDTAAIRSRGELRRWVFLSRDGEILRQGNPGRQSLYYLHLSLDGRYLTFERDGTGSGSFGVALDAGEETRLPIKWAGNQYYSADGRTAMDMVPSPGRIQLFDLGDPLNPVPVGEPLNTADGGFITGAVSADGTLVAVQTVEPDDPHRVLKRVVVFDRGLRQRTVVLRNTLRDGLQFEGRYLFVGTQRNPIPAYFEMASTKGILVYDLSDL